MLNVNDIAVLADEVAAEALGARVQKIRDGRQGEISLALRAPGRTVRIMIAAGHRDARIHLASVPVTRRPAPTPFVQLLRRELLGSRLAAVGAHDGDRLVELVFATRREGEPSAHWRLVGELSGRHGNLFLLDGAGVIRGSLRANVSHRRALAAGAPWIPPDPPPTTLAQASSTLQVGSASETVEGLVESEITHREDQVARSALLRDLRKLRKRAARRLEHVTRDQEKAARAEQLQRWGELLQGAWGQVAAGASKAQVTNYHDPAMPAVEVPLDPALSLGDNVTRYFKEAKRLKAAQSRIAARRLESERLISALQVAVDRVTPDADAATIEALRHELTGAGLMPRPRAAATRRGRALEKSLPYWRFASQAGLPILVGKSARDNDRLTLRVARGRDLWLHVDGAAGSHVIVRLEKGAAADHQTLLDAATLAVHYSKRRQDTGVDVRYTLRKHVAKPKGAAPGLVTLAGAKSIFVKPDPQRLARLFSSRA